MTQAEVNDTNADPTQDAAAGNDAQEPSLDSLLSEYDETPKETPKEPATQVAPQPTDEVAEFVQRQMRKEQNDAITSSAKQLREAAGTPHLSEAWFEGQLHVAATKDPRIMRAFENREVNPGAWKSIITKLGKDLAKELTQPQTDQASTDSWNAVEASVHSASTSKAVEKELDWSAMTDQEFFAAKAKEAAKHRR